MIEILLSYQMVKRLKKIKVIIITSLEKEKFSFLREGKYNSPKYLITVFISLSVLS